MEGDSRANARGGSLYNLLQLCKKHTQACSQAVRLVPFHAIIMSLMLEQQKQLGVLTEEITTLGQSGDNLH